LVIQAIEDVAWDGFVDRQLEHLSPLPSLISDDEIVGPILLMQLAKKSVAKIVGSSLRMS